jgi:hypothetical protein
VREQDHQNPHDFFIPLVRFLGGAIHQHPDPENGGQQQGQPKKRHTAKNHK